MCYEAVGHVLSRCSRGPLSGGRPPHPVAIGRFSTAAAQTKTRCVALLVRNLMRTAVRGRSLRRGPMCRVADPGPGGSKEVNLGGSLAGLSSSSSVRSTGEPRSSCAISAAVELLAGSALVASIRSHLPIDSGDIAEVLPPSVNIESALGDQLASSRPVGKAVTSGVPGPCPF